MKARMMTRLFAIAATLALLSACTDNLPRGAPVDRGVAVRLNHLRAHIRDNFAARRQLRVGDVHVVDVELLAPLRGDERLAEGVDVLHLVGEASHFSPRLNLVR